MTPPRLPRRYPLALLPTPLQRAERLERWWGCGPVWVKRDDLTGFGVAGNKARPLEYLIGDAQGRGADTLVVTGGVGSNFCAAAALAARVAGLRCDIRYAGAEPNPWPVTARLAHAAGASLHFLPDTDRGELDAAVLRYADDLTAQGRRPYPLPRGGATDIGAVGFAAAVAELATQCAANGITNYTIVLPTGSGCSQAGLIAGLAAAPGLHATVIGAAVSRPPDQVADTVTRLARDCADLLGIAARNMPAARVRDARGPGFGHTDPATRATAAEALHHAGLLLDGTYGAKALAVAHQVARESEAPVIFWYTGGLAKALAEAGATSA